LPWIEGEGIPVPSSSPAKQQETAQAGEISCEHVVIDAIDGIWHRVMPMLKDAANWSEITAKMEGVDDIHAKLKDGEYALWLCLRDGQVLAAVVVGTTTHSRCMVVDIHYGGGMELEHWIGPFYETIVDRGRTAGCRFIRVCGRDGWGRPLKKLGFTKAYTAFMREI
jgi:hypothetical protein